MSNLEQQTIDKLFRDLIRVYSTSATSMIGLDAIKMAITELACDEGELADKINKLSTKKKKFTIPFILQFIYNNNFITMFCRNKVKFI